MLSTGLQLWGLLPVIFVALAVVMFLRYPLGLLMLAVMLGFH
jgi:hypothetical protein